MKALIFSDLHCGIYKDHESLGNRFETSIRILVEVLNKEVDCILFCGDLYDIGKNPPARVVNIVLDIFNKYLKVPFFAISGNHDISHNFIGDSQGISLLTHLDTVIQKFNLIDDGFIPFRDYTIFGAAYRPNGKEVVDVISKFPVMENRKSILLTHQNYPGYIGGQEFNVSDVSKFDFVFNGHIHLYHQFSPTGYNVGNPFHRDLGDIGDPKGYLILEDGVITRHLFTYPEVARVQTVSKPTITTKAKVDFKTPKQVMQDYCNDRELLKIGLSYL